jgi:polysaccharide export outer membrane protein
MEPNKTKSIPILMAIFLLILQGCNHNKVKSQDRIIDTNEQTSSVTEDSNQTEEIIGNEKEPSISEFIVGPGDRLEIMVYRHDDLTREVWIDPTGKFMYPLTGDISAAGLSIFKVRDRIGEGLSKYINDPQITVRILSIQSQKIIVLGEVQSAGFFLAEAPMTALDAISQAGGFTYDGQKKTVMLIRGGMEKPELRVLDLEKVLKEGDLTDNIMLKSGDIIYVPRTFISNVAAFFTYISAIISPIVNGERGYLYGKEIIEGKSTSTLTK